MSAPTKATVLIENERVIVTEYRLAPGASTGWHRHGHDYVVVPLTDGRLKLLTKDGESFADMKAPPISAAKGLSMTSSMSPPANMHSSRSS